MVETFPGELADSGADIESSPGADHHEGYKVPFLANQKENRETDGHPGEAWRGQAPGEEAPHLHPRHHLLLPPEGFEGDDIDEAVAETDGDEDDDVRDG